MTRLTIEKSIFLKATPEVVWDYLTDPNKLAIWFHKPTAPLTEGPYELFSIKSGNRLIWGDVLVAKPFTELVYTFIIPPMGDGTSTVKWKLTPVAGGTKLSLIHEGLPDTDDAFGLILSLDDGWDEHLGRVRVAINPEQ